ncbi:MAG: 3-hydroxybutyrate dehydrogenase [Alphaproteobacteria bacterium]|nr:3-hydroxybutyrate dehydrogenase [Alphaproteobacteria bacterium]
MTHQVAIITGSTSGIGLGIAEALAKQGTAIMLNGFGDDAQIAAARARIAATGAAVDYCAADVTSADAVAAMVQQAQEKFGRVDVMVNNAGIQFVSAIENFPLEKWHAVLATNLSSVFYATRSVLPLMRAQQFGRIINIASAHGLVASANKSAYVAAKHGVVGLTKVTALETAGTGITCNAICPGWVLTPLVQKQIDAIAEREKISNDDASKKLLSEKQPSLQFVTPEQVGALAVFLCSDAAAQMTGSSYSIDGGWTAV